MYDTSLVKDIFFQINLAIEKIQYRFSSIIDVHDFTDSQDGLMKLDSICMLLTAIGESLKNVDKITNYTLLIKYPTVNWKAIKGLRDIISHHYFDIDADGIFWICKNEIHVLQTTVNKIINEI
jgi:uncharacterized protein with HEPN domain